MTDVLITPGELADLVTKEPCVIIDTRNRMPMARDTSRTRNVHEIFTISPRRRRKACMN